MLLYTIFILGRYQFEVQTRFKEKDCPCICISVGSFSNLSHLCVFHILSSAGPHPHQMISIDIFKTVRKSFFFFFWVSIREASHAQYLTIASVYVWVCKCVSVCFVIIGTSRGSINSQIWIEFTQCSNLNLPHGSLWCGPTWCLHYRIPAVQKCKAHTFSLKYFFHVSYYGYWFC